MAAEPPGPEPLSVMHLCAPADMGGLERVVQGLSQGFASGGHQVSVVAVVAPGHAEGPFFEGLGGGSVRTYPLQLPPRAYLRERREVARLLDTVRPHVLHTHGYRSDLLHGGPARRRGVATVSTLHGSSRMGGTSHLSEWIQERALARFDGVIAVSVPLQAALEQRGVPRERIHLVPNAWVAPTAPLTRAEARRRLGLPQEARVIGWTGRLIPIKGADVFLRALSRLPPDDHVASVIGDGGERLALESLAAELGLGERIHFHGAVAEAGRLFAAFDLFVLSSRSEGTPMVLLEAMGSATPVVATAVGGVPDVLAQGEGGWLVPPEAPDALAQAIGHALSDPVAASERAARGRARVQREFSPEVWIRRHESAYRSAMRRRGRQS